MRLGDTRNKFVLHDTGQGETISKIEAQAFIRIRIGDDIEDFPPLLFNLRENSVQYERSASLPAVRLVNRERKQMVCIDRLFGHRVANGRSIFQGADAEAPSVRHFFQFVVNGRLVHGTDIL